MAELFTIITLRQGTTEEWSKSNVRLREGEVGLEYFPNGIVKLKAGLIGEDGQGKLWADLPYVGDDVQTALLNKIFAETERAQNAELNLQKQINIIMDNPDTENVIDSINEFTKYIQEHGEIAESFRTGIESLNIRLIDLKDSVLDLQSTDTSLIESITALEETNKVHKVEYKTLLDATLDNKESIEKITNIIGEIKEGKTLIQLIADETIRAQTAENKNAEEITRINDILINIIDNNSEGLDSIKELATWVQEHGNDASNMITEINNNTNAILLINNAETGILAQAKEYANTKISEIPVATIEQLGLVKFDNNTIKMNDNQQLHVSKISTDMIEQGEQTLVLNGGSAEN